MLITQEFLKRAARNLNLADFSSVSEPILIGPTRAAPEMDQQHILRMMLRSDRLPLSIPSELHWLRAEILRLDALQRAHGLHNPFIYATSRHGFVSSTMDDEWHVDGFSMRLPHAPEQNYIFASRDGTEALINSWQIPRDFDPFKHNIQHWFQDYQENATVATMEPGSIYLIDPYCVHRRPPLSVGTIRTFWRVSFIPIEIEDDTGTQNPLFPVKRYGRSDIRVRLTRYI